MGIVLVDASAENKKKKWEPKQWRVEYDRIVAFSVAGVSNIEIAEKLGFTKEYVSTILCLPSAKVKYAEYQNKIVNQFQEDIPTRLSKIAERTVARIESMINDDDLFEKNPFSVIDRGMDILKGLGHLRGGGNGAVSPDMIPTGGNVNIQNNNTTIITTRQESELTAGLKRVAEVRELHEINKKE